MKNLFNKTIKNTVESNDKIILEDKPSATKDYAGSYICPICNNEINFENGHEDFSTHSANCPNNKKEQFKNNNSNLIFNLNKPSKFKKILKGLYINSELQLQEYNLTIDDFFKFSENSYYKIIEKLKKSNFKIKNLETNSISNLQNNFIEITPEITELISKEEQIFFGKVVIFEDIFGTSPTYRMSFSNLHKNKNQIRFKVYNNTQNEKLRKLYNQLILIPSKHKKKVNNNNGSYSLGKAVFVQAKIIEKDGNLHFSDIKNVWLVDANNKHY